MILLRFHFLSVLKLINRFIDKDENVNILNLYIFYIIVLCI